MIRVMIDLEPARVVGAEAHNALDDARVQMQWLTLLLEVS